MTNLEHLAKRKAKIALEALAAIAANAEERSDFRIKAAEAILDRALGRASAKTEETPPPVILTGMDEVAE